MRAAPRDHCGVALLTVMLVVFIAALAIAALVTSQQLSIRRSTLYLQQQQARWYALGGEQWAAAILQRDLEDGAVDDVSEDWAQLPPSLPVTGGEISGRILDLQGRFNLNNLLRTDPNSNTVVIDEAQLAWLQSLLHQLKLNSGIAQAIADWIDPDQEILFPDGAEDADYTGLSPPYLAANRRFQNITELRLIKGVDNETYQRLTAEVSVLPVLTTVNVNTASALLLSALGDDFKRLFADAGPGERESYASVEEFLRAADLPPSDPAADLLGVGSSYFLVRVDARVGEGRVQLQSVLARDSGQVRVLSREFGSSAL